MKVAAAVHGRFHAFELAARRHRAGLLAQLAITYPAFAARQFLLPGIKLATAPTVTSTAAGWPDAFDRLAGNEALRRPISDTVLVRIAPRFTWAITVAA